jgi:predicted aspartyl protease
MNSGAGATTALAVSLLTVVLDGAQAQPVSQTCGPLEEVASLEMSLLADGARVSVPLVIDGKPLNLLVDTGAGMSSLTTPAATALGLWPRETQGVHLVNADGGAVRRYYLADSFRLGPLAASRIPFLQQTASEDASVSGMMGPDLMLRYDVEMNFAEEKMTYFSQDHCPGHIVHWTSAAVTQVPIRITARARDYPPPFVNPAAASLGADFVSFLMSFGSPILGTDIRATVMLDGREFTANLDTGLEVSTINSETARDAFQIDMKDVAPETSAPRQVAPTQATPASSATEAVTVTALRQQHRFHTLTFGGVSVVNPLFVLKPPAEDAHRVGSAQGPDITIGMNVLRKLHLYFAFGERMLYISTAGPPPGANAVQK